jgi:hypothetical protein
MIARQPVQGCLAFAWHGPGCRAAADDGELCAPPEPALCQAATDLDNGQRRLQDMLGNAIYAWERNDLQARGLCLDVPPC